MSKGRWRYARNHSKRETENKPVGWRNHDRAIFISAGGKLCQPEFFIPDKQCIVPGL